MSWFALTRLQELEERQRGHHTCTMKEAHSFCEPSSWHHLKEITLTDRQPGGKVASEAHHSGRGLGALHCLKTTSATIGQASWEAFAPVWCSLTAPVHAHIEHLQHAHPAHTDTGAHTGTNIAGSWGRNRDYRRWTVSQLELEHPSSSPLSLVLSLLSASSSNRSLWPFLLTSWKPPTCYSVSTSPSL